MSRRLVIVSRRFEVWTMRDGGTIRVSDMDTLHVARARELIERKLSRGLAPHPGACTVPDVPCYGCVVQSTAEERMRGWIARFDEELKRRAH